MKYGEYMKKIVSCLLVLTMALSCLLVPGDVAKAENREKKTLQNPYYDTYDTENGYKSYFWDTVEFGSYPTIEIVEKATGSGLYSNGVEEIDYEVNEELYKELKAATDWDENGDLVLDGVKYRRICHRDYDISTIWYMSYYLHYDWDAGTDETETYDIYHYFRYEPIEWLVIEVDGNKALLFSKLAIDYRNYNSKSHSDYTFWQNATVRSWLNGYGPSENRENEDYSSANFINTAFSSQEQASILTSTVKGEARDSSGYLTIEGMSDTQDKVYLLGCSETMDAYNSDIWGDYSVPYSINNLYAEGLLTKRTAYAAARGLTCYPKSNIYPYSVNWLLRTVGGTAGTCFYQDNGSISDHNCSSQTYGYGIRPVICIDLDTADYTDSNLYHWPKFKKPCYGTHYKVVTEKGVPATCTEDGTTDASHCAYCKEVLSEHTTIPALGHVVVEDIGYAATCVKSGLTDGSHCSVCNAVLVKQTIIANKGHKEVADNGYEATCTKAGKTDGSHCATCGEVFIAQKTIPALGHAWQKSSVLSERATTSASGKTVYVCETCGSTKSTTIPKISKVSLSASQYVYDGKVKSPSVKVYDSKGLALKKDTDYTLKVPTGRKLVGKYTYTITFKGKYKGTKSLSMVINPKSTSLTSMTALTKGFKLVWAKRSTQTTGYQIQYATSSTFSSPKTLTVSSYSTTSKSITGLTAKKKYYARIRAYKTVNGVKYYSAWSGKKYVTTK